MLSYTITNTDGNSRRGICSTSHGSFETPNFMPVGTKATVKGVDVERLLEVGTQITLVNTYHLWLRPGHDLIRRLGGVHAFCNWKGPILSDSGGFQVFSLKGLRKLSEEGVEFRSHLDGALCFLSPEKSIQIQEALGVDIAMVLDECPSSKLDFTATEKSLELTLRWAERSLNSKTKQGTAIFGITQGGLYSELRERSAKVISELPFDGCAIGGLSVGESSEEMYKVLSYHVRQLPSAKIRYLMGVGTPRDIVEAVKQGVDLFDCVMPTRAGRFGRVFLRGSEPYINLKNARFKEDSTPIDATCDCLACRNYGRAYLHHLFQAGEMLGPQLASIHNLRHYLSLMESIRNSITNGSFLELYNQEKGRWDLVNDNW